MQRQGSSAPHTPGATAPRAAAPAWAPRRPRGPISAAAAADTYKEAVEAVAQEEGLGIVAADPNLLGHEGHLRYRWEQYKRTREALAAAGGGSLAAFATGHQHFGIMRHKGCTVYREWAPGATEAQLIGDFNGWAGAAMERDQFGTWSITLPHGPGGEPAIPHGSRVKIRLRHPGGWWVDRIPAWIKWATVPQGQMGAKYDGIHWDPPAAAAYAWRHERPRRPESLRIYEAHVGMSSEEERVASYTHFKGTPEELRALIDEAHRLGISVLLDVVHSHISRNAEDGLAGFDLGQPPEASYFLQAGGCCLGDAGYHRQWDSRLLNYAGFEVLRYLLSNLRYWIEEFRFDGFRFDGVTSMLYHHHGIDVGFSGGYHEYFSPATNVDAVVYLMLANELVHELLPDAITIAEDVSGMPALCRPVAEGGVGFDYRLGMESHDQALVGDQTVAFRLMGAEMYTGMSALTPPSPVVERGVALHKMIRSVTQALGGEAYLNFMGNEFGHPEWIDFPRRAAGVAGPLPAGAPLRSLFAAACSAARWEASAWAETRGGGPQRAGSGRGAPAPAPHVAPPSCTPEELRALIDEAHRLGISVLLDVVHSHISRNAEDGLAGFDLGQPPEASYFLQAGGCCLGDAGYHRQWDSRLLNYAGFEVLRYLLSNLRYWIEEFRWGGERGGAGGAGGAGQARGQKGRGSGQGAQPGGAGRAGQARGQEGRVPVPESGKYRVVLDSDAFEFGGKGRVGHDPAGTAEDSGALFHNRGQSMFVLSPSRTVVAYKKVDEAAEAEARRAAQAAAPPPTTDAAAAGAEADVGAVPLAEAAAGAGAVSRTAAGVMTEVQRSTG
eukprot:scaffold14.g1269.t1